MPVLLAFLFNVNISDLGIVAVGYSAAIIGGFLSGFITLMGVNKTIKHQKIERYLESYPEKIGEFKVIEDLIDWGKSDGYYNVFIIKSNEKLFNELELSSAKISARLYRETLKIKSIYHFLFENFYKEMPKEEDELTGEKVASYDDAIVKSVYQDRCLSILSDYAAIVRREEEKLNKLVEDFQPD
ncbi:hypothetical protein JCM19047_2477 [Bacillus sp. JCM 19047]|nr:hypothetical protein JCM19047_2477 [Bacillus sp. JCM 19047]